MDAHARWKSKRLLAVVSFPSKRSSVRPGETTARRVQGACIWRGDLTEGFLRYRFGGLIFEGLIHGRAYFRNFTVYCEKGKISGKLLQVIM